MRVLRNFAVRRPRRRGGGGGGGRERERDRERERGHAGKRSKEENKSRVCVVRESKWPMKRN